MGLCNMVDKMFGLPLIVWPIYGNFASDFVKEGL